MPPPPKAIFVTILIFHTKCTLHHPHHHITSAQALIRTGWLDGERWISSHCSVRIWTSPNLSQSHSSDCAARREKGTLPDRNAEEVPLVSHYHKIPDHKDVWRARMCASSLCNHHGNFLGRLSSLVFNFGCSSAQLAAVLVHCCYVTQQN